MDPSPAKGVSRVDIGLYAAAGVAAAVGWLVHRIAFGEPILPVDDAYITLHNALSFWQPDLAYPETPPLVGSTSGWHTLLIALAALALAPTSASYAMAGAAMVVYALGVVHLARALDLDRWLVLPMVAAGLLVGDLPHHLFNGLETGLALAALTWTLALWCSPASTRRDAALAVLCGQLPWIRPELAAVAAMAIGTQLLTREDRRVAGPRMVGLAIASGLPWLIAYFVATGGPISSTARVKARWFTEFCAPVDVRLARTGTHLLEFTGRVGVLSLGLLFAWRSAAGRAAPTRRSGTPTAARGS